jgi:chromosome segregation ATPase
MSSKEIEMRKIVIIAALVAALTLGLAGAALAQQTTPSGSVGKKNAGARLEKARERISKAIERAGKVKDKALARAKKAEDRLDKVIAKLKEQGKDVSRLLEYKEVLASKLKTAESDYEALISKLKEAEGLASEKTLEQFKAALKEAKELRGRIKADVQEMKQYTRTVVRPAIKELAGNGKAPGNRKAQTAPAK